MHVKELIKKLQAIQKANPNDDLLVVSGLDRTGYGEEVVEVTVTEVKVNWVDKTNKSKINVVDLNCSEETSVEI